MEDQKTVWSINTEVGRKLMPVGWKLEVLDNKINPGPGREYVGLLTKLNSYYIPELHAIYYGYDIAPMHASAIEYIEQQKGWPG